MIYLAMSIDVRYSDAYSSKKIEFRSTISIGITPCLDILRGSVAGRCFSLMAAI